MSPSRDHLFKTSELYVHSSCLSGQNRLTPLSTTTYDGAMSKPLVITDEPLTPELARAFENARRNLLWFNEHVEELEVYKRYRGKYVASAGQELFVADTAREVRRLALEKHPDDLAHVRYIQRENLSRIYASALSD